MFVEIVRLLLVVLFTAAGFWMGRDLGPASVAVDGMAGMLGCLVGYVLGGFLGRSLTRVVGVVERRIDRLPPSAVLAGLVGGTAGAVIGATLAAPVLVLFDPARRTAARRSHRVDHRVHRVPDRGAPERSAVRSPRPLDPSARPRHAVRRRATGSSSTRRRSWTASSSRSPARASSGPTSWFRGSCSTSCRGSATPATIRAPGAPNGASRVSTRCAAKSIGRVLVLDDEVPEIRDVDAKLVALGQAPTGSIADHRRQPGPQRRGPGRPDRQPPAPRRRPRARDRGRSAAAGRTREGRPPTGSGSRVPRRRLDGRGERRRRAWSARANATSSRRRSFRRRPAESCSPGRPRPMPKLRRAQARSLQTRSLQARNLQAGTLRPGHDAPELTV